MKMRCTAGLVCDGKNLWVGMHVEAGGGGQVKEPFLNGQEASKD